MSRTDDSLSDEQLVKLYREGDQQAMEQLVERYQAKVFGFFKRLCWNRTLAEDLAQDTFIKVISSLRQKEPEVPFSMVLFHIARIHWYTYLRKKYRTVKTVGKIEEHGDVIPGEESVGEDLEEFDERKQKIKLMKKAMESLSPEKRIVVELSYFLEVPYKEIAQILEIPIGTVKSRLNSAIRRLRGIMESDEN
ncbi:MAG: RNA polymerase sigma factor [Planctomycetota bacterium]|nr:RNA polymerase sigma factor [Planctomycetota bacterium]